MSTTSGRVTSDRILDFAEQLLMTRGYNKFSYADIAAEFSISRASIHYYFPSKSDLGREVIARYRRRTSQRLAEISRQLPSYHERMDSYVEIFVELLRDGYLMCPGGMLAVEFVTLPEVIQKEVRDFFREHERWLQLVLKAAEEAREVPPSITMERRKDVARYLLAGLEGGLMMARLHADEELFRGVVDHLLSPLGLRPQNLEGSSHGHCAEAVLHREHPGRDRTDRQPE
jgi:TetR/AcrR family transcriptional repressor of nem operon